MRTLNVLVGGEESQEITAAFIALGHNAWSCDLYYPGAKGLPHYQCDVRDVLTVQLWDLFIVHPVCKYMANSGNKHLYIGGRKVNGRYEPRWELMRQAAEFMREMLNAPIEHICAENPIMHPYAKQIVGIEQTQTIHPWQFGHGEQKATCLWLKNLPPLTPTNIVDGREQRIWRMAPGPERERMRSRTYPGIAAAMATQWSNS
jgi:hypothetical protein